MPAVKAPKRKDEEKEQSPAAFQEAVGLFRSRTLSRTHTKQQQTRSGVKIALVLPFRNNFRAVHVLRSKNNPFQVFRMRIRNMAVRYCEFLDRKGVTFNVTAGVVCAAFLGILDYYSDIYFGMNYTLLFFYFLPVAFVAWFAGRNAAVAMAVLCVGIKVATKFNPGETLLLLLWTNGSAFVFYLVFGLLLAKMRQLLDQERVLSRTDHLTGALNRKAFLEVMTNEILRLGRQGQPFSLAYLDLDHFKEINDTHGHSMGDFLLQKVVATISAHLRRTDVVSRQGGDEFAILFTNTDEPAALVAIQKIRDQLHLSMKQYNLAVTFSIGVLTCTGAPNTADEVISLADNLMYEVKRSGKNGIRQAAYTRCAGGD
jgi:diguanylate cyclase (GGDEF)-like protein